MDRGVIATANELFEARHYPGVVAMCSDALEDEPECVPLLLIRARAHMALRRDLDAQADLRDIIRLDPRCSLGYRLLGELSARLDENASAAVFFREALRLDPEDREAQEWLQIVTAPSPSPARLARGTQPPDQVDRAARAEHEERPTQPFGRVDARRVRSQAATPATRPPVRQTPTPEPLPPPPELERPTLSGRPPIQPPAKPAPRLTARAPTPELPGFGEYLVAAGILTRERLRAAQAYQRSMRVQLSTAIVTLGLASPQRIEWAAVAHQSQLPRG